MQGRLRVIEMFACHLILRHAEDDNFESLLRAAQLHPRLASVSSHSHLSYDVGHPMVWFAQIAITSLA